MSSPHGNDDHQHGPNWEHMGIQHGDHVDYLRDENLHHVAENGTAIEHSIDLSDTNPDCCTPTYGCGCHDSAHLHGPGCGREPVPRGNPIDYFVDGHLHHPHVDHRDDHGLLTVVS